MRTTAFVFCVFVFLSCHFKENKVITEYNQYLQKVAMYDTLMINAQNDLDLNLKKMEDAKRRGSFNEAAAYRFKSDEDRNRVVKFSDSSFFYREKAARIKPE